MRLPILVGLLCCILLTIATPCNGGIVVEDPERDMDTVIAFFTLLLFVGGGLIWHFATERAERAERELDRLRSASRVDDDDGDFDDDDLDDDEDDDEDEDDVAAATIVSEKRPIFGEEYVRLRGRILAKLENGEITVDQASVELAKLNIGTAG